MIVGAPPRRMRPCGNRTELETAARGKEKQLYGSIVTQIRHSPPPIARPPMAIVASMPEARIFRSPRRAAGLCGLLVRRPGSDGRRPYDAPPEGPGLPSSDLSPDPYQRRLRVRTDPRR